MTELVAKEKSITNEEEQEHKSDDDNPQDSYLKPTKISNLRNIETEDIKDSTTPKPAKISHHSRSIFPKEFYCPVTKEIFKDPVVKTDGLSYERFVILDESEKVYPNRALASIIKETLSLETMVLYEKKKSFFQDEDGDYRSLPQAFNCPITLNLMHEPVIDPEGNTFEGRSIRAWIKDNGNLPLSRNGVNINDLYPNKVLHMLLLEEMDKDEGLMHPSIKLWKEEENLRFGSFSCRGKWNAE